MGTLKPIRRVHQIRQYAPEPVPDEVIDQLLELVRWTGSSKNSQPWHFIVIRDRETLKKIAALRPNINWAAAAPVGIAIVLDGAAPMSEAYDEGRVTERLMTGATMLGYGAGVAWFGEVEHQEVAKKLLGIPEVKTSHQMVMLGKAKTREDPRSYGPKRGRKPMIEVASFERFGTNKR
jgi:nitroreductase